MSVVEWEKMPPPWCSLGPEIAESVCAVIEGRKPVPLPVADTLSVRLKALQRRHRWTAVQLARALKAVPASVRVWCAGADPGPRRKLAVEERLAELESQPCE